MGIKRVIAKKALIGVSLFFLVMLINFTIVNVAPGGPEGLLLGPRVPKEARERLREHLGLDKPIHIRFIRYISGVLRGDLGISYAYGFQVADLIKKKLPNTIFLGGLTLLLTVAIGIPLGVMASKNPYGKLDRALTTFSVMGFALPEFWLGLVILMVFAYSLGWFPIGGMKSLDPSGHIVIDRLRYLALPLTTGVITNLVSVNLFVRSSLLEALKQDYVLVARGKGLSERIVFYKHALRNALIPVATNISLRIAYIFSGYSVVIETVFSWPGIGLLLWESLNYRDYPVILGLFLIYSSLIISINIIMDLVYAIIDPRISYE
jgi:peptide/nickel transport system permease protein